MLLRELILSLAVNTLTDDRQVLEKVKKKRNSLAHGDESFSRCARDLTLTDLETIKDTVIQFIQEILICCREAFKKPQLTRYARWSRTADPLRPQKLNSNTGENTKSH